MHSRISINTLCLPPGGFHQHVERVARLGAPALSPTLEDLAGLEAGRASRLLRDTGLSVATLTHRAFGYATPEAALSARARLNATLEIAASIGAASVTLTTGGRGDLSWTEASLRFAAAIGPCAERAASVGVRLAIEPTSHLYADVSIAHRLTDTTALARDAGIHLGIDLFACWFDADIEEAIAAAIPLCTLVQVSDYVYGDRGLPCRATPGDGVIPLRRLLPAIVAAGFDGWFDIEIFGPRIEREGAEAALRRAATTIAEILGSS